MNLKKYRKILNPEKQFKQQLWLKLDKQWQQEYSTSFNWFQTRTFRYATVVVIAVLICSSFGTGAYAYNSPQVTEGTRLYKVKQIIEKAEEKIKITPAAKVRFYLKQVERREAEVKVLQRLKQHTVNTNKKIEAVQVKLDKAVELLDKKPIKNPALKKRVDNYMEKRQKFLDKKKQKIENQEEIAERIKTWAEQRPTSTPRVINKMLKPAVYANSTTTTTKPILKLPKPGVQIIKKVPIIKQMVSSTKKLFNQHIPPKQALTVSEPASSTDSDLIKQPTSSSTLLNGPSSSTKTGSPVLIKPSFGSARP